MHLKIKELVFGLDHLFVSIELWNFQNTANAEVLAPYLNM